MFNELEKKILHITTNNFSGDELQDEMKFYRDKGLTFEVNFFRNKLIYALYKSGIDATVKGSKLKDSDVIINKDTLNEIRLELKVTRKGTLSWLIKNGLEKHIGANLYLFMIWNDSKQNKFKKLENYLSSNNFIYEIEKTRDWNFYLIKRE
jgi:hypothetical protein